MEKLSTNPILQEVCIVGEKPNYSPYGYVITPDGMIYSLIEKYCHGVILAMIYPELATKHGYDAPDEDYDVFEYQRFELDHYKETAVIRISISLISGSLNISKSEDKPATPGQMLSLTKIFREQGLNQQSDIETHLMPMTVSKFMKQLRNGEI